MTQLDKLVTPGWYAQCNPKLGEIHLEKDGIREHGDHSS